MNSRAYADRLRSVLTEFPHTDYLRVVDVLESAWTRDGTIYTCGNGGSAATASHMVADFGNLCGWPIVCLNDNTAMLTATANDVCYDAVFRTAIRPLLKKQDVLCVFSGSGNSPNIVSVVQYAKPFCTTIGFLGNHGGAVGPLVDVALVVPSSEMQLIEDVHLATVHMLTQHFRQRSA